MGDRGYRLLGFVVWNGGRWYLRRRTRRMSARVPSPWVLVGGAALGTGIIGGALAWRAARAGGPGAAGRDLPDG